MLGTITSSSQRSARGSEASKAQRKNSGRLHARRNNEKEDGSNINAPLVVCYFSFDVVSAFLALLSYPLSLSVFLSLVVS